MPISYTQLSTYNLLLDKSTYNLIDTVCKVKFADWDIVAFERAILGENSQASYSEAAVRNAIYEQLLDLDKAKPSLLYLEQGNHYATEIFRIVPETIYPRESFKMFWSHISRVFSDYVLPIDKYEFRKVFLSELEKLGIRQQTNRDYYISQFTVRNTFGNEGMLNAKDIREAMYTVEARNQAFSKRTANNGANAYLDAICSVLKERAEEHSTENWTLKLREDFDIHSLCFAVDSSCTEKQRDGAFLRWGIFTGEPLSYAECGRRLGVTGKCVALYEHAVIRHLISNKKMLFYWELQE